MKKTITVYFIAFMAIFVMPAFAAVHIVHEGESIQAAVKKAKPGDTIKVMPGIYHELVFIDKDDIHLFGVVQHGRWPVMDGENKLNDGILVAGHNVTIERMKVKGYLGNGIMTQGSNNFKILRNVVEGPSSFYGIFPQFGKNGLVAYNTVTGIEDAAIYVGMSENIDVLYNETYANVMGIEIENSYNILVEGNSVYDNSTGISVVLFPGLPIKGAENTIVRNNFVTNNNHPNFAREGSLLRKRDGIGIWIFAADETSIEDNLIKGNNSAGVFLSDHGNYSAAPDPKMDPRPDYSRVLENVFINNGSRPKGLIKEMLASTDRTVGADLFSTGEGRKNCVSNRQSITEFGTNRWTECAEGETSADVVSYQLSQPLKTPSFTPEQMGRITYLSVCSGCHSYTGRIIGPPMITIQSLYQDNPKGLIAYIKDPKKKWPGYPEMPPQNYLSEDALREVAKYIVYDLKN